MANIQGQFIKFHDAIKLTFDDDEVLRTARDGVLDTLKQRIKENFEAKDKEVPKFEKFDQGSYAMCTGIKPQKGDYDIDVGLKFEIDRDDHPDPVKVKEWVYDALSTETHKVIIRRPCVTVFVFADDKETLLHHVDLAVYSADNKDGALYLAKGMSGSAPENRIWEAADPKGLMDAISDRFEDGDAEQFRRVIRYMKRWRDLRFSIDGNAAPIGIGLTFAGYYWFKGATRVVDSWTNKTQRDDLAALLNLVKAMLGQFYLTIEDSEVGHRLKVELPVNPGGDLFAKMTLKQMATFKEKLEALKTALEAAQDETDPVEACKKLAKQFGDDFPIPEAKATSSASGPGIIGSSSSG